jgi:hypothetical protein
MWNEVKAALGVELHAVGAATDGAGLRVVVHGVSLKLSAPLGIASTSRAIYLTR